MHERLLFSLILVVVFKYITRVDSQPNFIIFQPDDFVHFEEWLAPGHLPTARLGPQTFPAPLENLERLRLEGMTFNRAYTASPMCGTSRYSTITGRYPSRAAFNRAQSSTIPSVTIPNTKLVDDATVADGQDCSRNNIAAILAQNGYATGMVGKWHLSRFRVVSYSYPQLQETVQKCGFDYAEGLYAENLDSNIYADSSFSHNMEWVTERGINFITESVSEGKPFFLYFNPTVPHGSGNVLESLTSFGCRQTPEGELPEEPRIPNYASCDSYRESVLERARGQTDNSALGSILVDDSVGFLFDTLDQLGITNNTMFLFQIDHGQEGKASLYEPGIRLASFVHYPNERRMGSSFDGLVSTIDLAPTILDFAGVTSDVSFDGISWRKAAQDQAVEQVWKNRCIFAELQTDRAVVCGCSKSIQINDSTESTTLRLGRRTGAAVTPPLEFDLCGGGAYVVTPQVSPEVKSSSTGNSVFLESALQCHLDRTSASGAQPLFLVCDGELSAVTEEPTVVPTAEPSWASLEPSVIPILVTTAPTAEPSLASQSPSLFPKMTSETPTLVPAVKVESQAPSLLPKLATETPSLLPSDKPSLVSQAPSLCEGRLSRMGWCVPVPTLGPSKALSTVPSIRASLPSFMHQEIFEPSSQQQGTTPHKRMSLLPTLDSSIPPSNIGFSSHPNRSKGEAAPQDNMSVGEQGQTSSKTLLLAVPVLTMLALL